MPFKKSSEQYLFIAFFVKTKKSQGIAPRLKTPKTLC